LKWLELLDRVPKLVQLGAMLVAVFVAGAGFSQVFNQQIGLPATVSATVDRVDNLEHRMLGVETAISDIASNSMRLRSLSAKVDSIDALSNDMYCIIRAHALALDPTAECVLRPRGGPVP
jgi:hypothetical protein